MWPSIVGVDVVGCYCWMLLLDVFVCWSFCALLDVDNVMIIPLSRKKRKY